MSTDHPTNKRTDGPATSPAHVDGATANDAGLESSSVGERIPLARERVRLEKREVERVAAHIRLRTHEEDVRVAETLHRERIDIERVPVDQVMDDVPVTRTEGDVTVIPIVEEVLVKRFRVIEEIRLRPRLEQHVVEETVQLRRQVATVDDGPGARAESGADERGADPAAPPGPRGD